MVLSVSKNIDLIAHNSFHIHAYAEHFCYIDSRNQLEALSELCLQEDNLFILGGGSNILLLNHLHGWVVHPKLHDFYYHNETQDSMDVTIGAGVNWHQLVCQTLSDGYSGLENLSLIPGNCGAAPIQNIGAYGIELSDKVISVEVYDIRQGKVQHMQRETCQFSYRNSLFKQQPERYLILSLTLRLDKVFQPQLEYYALHHLQDKTLYPELSAQQVAAEIIKIRQTKLPDPKLLGNAGSFFKNPIVTREFSESLRSQYPDLVSFYVDEHSEKLAAGWLIEQLGYRGKRLGNVGVHEHQALVLVNYGQASGEEILLLSQEIQKAVYEHYGVQLEREVRLVGTSES